MKRLLKELLNRFRKEDSIKSLDYYIYIMTT